MQKAVEERADATEKLDELTTVAKQYEEAQQSVADYKKQLEDYILKVKIPLPSQNYSAITAKLILAICQLLTFIKRFFSDR